MFWQQVKSFDRFFLMIELWGLKVQSGSFYFCILFLLWFTSISRIMCIGIINSSNIPNRSRWFLELDEILNLHVTRSVMSIISGVKCDYVQSVDQFYRHPRRLLQTRGVHMIIKERCSEWHLTPASSGCTAWRGTDWFHKGKRFWSDTNNNETKDWIVPGKKLKILSFYSFEELLPWVLWKIGSRVLLLSDAGQSFLFIIKSMVRVLLDFTLMECNGNVKITWFSV